MSDENEGMGGSYTVDPETGKRTLTERTHDPLLPTHRPEPVAKPAPVVRKAKDEI